MKVEFSIDELSSLEIATRLRKESEEDQPKDMQDKYWLKRWTDLNKKLNKIINS